MDAHASRCDKSAYHYVSEVTISVVKDAFHLARDNRKSISECNGA